MNDHIVNWDGVMNDSIFVFERTNENSLLAAAVLKKYGNYRIMEIDQVDKEIFSPEDRYSFHWLGFQPVEYLAKKLRHDHLALIPCCQETPNASNIFICSGEYETITEMVFREILMDKDNNFDVPEEIADRWIGYAYQVEQFHKKTPAKQLTIKDQTFTINGFDTVEIGYNVIRMVFDYIFHNKAWNELVLRTDYNYMEAVEETKHLLSHFSQTDFSHVGGRVIGSQLINITDYHLYVAKRLVMLSGQIFKTSRIIGDRVHYASNASRRLAA